MTVTGVTHATEFRDAASRAREWLQKQRAERFEATLRPWERAVRATRVSPLEAGHARVRGIMSTISHLDTVMQMPRSEVQAQIQAMFLASCAPSIYGPIYETNQLAILRHNKWVSRDTTPWVVVTMPRRAGKTTACAQFALALLANVERMSILVFAPSLAQSSMFVQTVQGYFHDARLRETFPQHRMSKTRLALYRSKTDTRCIVARSSSIDAREPLSLLSQLRTSMTRRVA
jgi:hypothetical protein